MTVVDESTLLELTQMADMYASKCTQQEEKFDHYRRNGVTWRWEDCEAAYDLLRQLPDGWLIRDNWRRGKPLMDGVRSVTLKKGT